MHVSPRSDLMPFSVTLLRVATCLLAGAYGDAPIRLAERFMNVAGESTRNTFLRCPETIQGNSR